MTTKVKVSCDGCDATGVLELNISLSSVSVGGLIKSDQLCPNCGGSFSAPSGKYEKNIDGELIRVGDYLAS